MQNARKDKKTGRGASSYDRFSTGDVTLTSGDIAT